ncbi:MAG: phosphoribulokinase [Rhodospirillaceae bacterium]|jgi:phosphoribulokinase|nr:phosphoribulokinase [Rhodospirillaceae bacterium]MBT4218688.1 phosphoribulokinase [Rhodospirillaceae bacterium]MBT5309352.1 phosphoribulokinase [Rhodospirillaceae bacterium]MBT6406773.1 phosphoribulokinase [Rhodospirillaceae bacterium]MBT7356428.1 phosphoribulokinase [Rhodospirillaceae bacterium]
MAFQSDRPIILGIVGDSAAGKTTLASGIANILGPERVVIICTDDYHSCDRAERADKGISALNPQCNYIDILEQHTHLLRSGQPILKPTYNHDDGTLERPVYVEPREFIIFEGLLGYSSRTMRDAYDVKVYLEPNEDLRKKWRIRRDCMERGYQEDDVIRSLEKRVDDSIEFIEPQRTFADMVVSFYPPEGRSGETGAHLNVRHSLRPTLPHPDLTPIIEAGAKKGLRLELSRDVDGKPVDVLDIDGNVDVKRAQAMEDLLWNLVPEAQHMRDNVGTFRDETNHQSISHPLALSQLLITYHIVKAALGHHAI